MSARVYFMKRVKDCKDVSRDVNVFILQKNDRFVMKTTTKNRKRNNRFKNDRFLKKVRFSKMVVFKTIVFIKYVISLTMTLRQRSLTKRGNDLF